MCKRKVFQADRTIKVKARRWECVRLILEFWGQWGWSERREGGLVEEKKCSGECCGEVEGGMDQGWLCFLAFILCEMGATIGVWTQNDTCSNRFILAVGWKQTTGEVWIEAGGKLVERDHVGSNSGGAGEECSVRFMLGLFWSESNRISWLTAWREEGEKEGPQAPAKATGGVPSPSFVMRRAVATKRILGKEDELTLAILILKGQCPVGLPCR